MFSVLIEPFKFSFFSLTSWGIDLDYCDIEWFAFERNRDHSVVYKIAHKYCILDSFFFFFFYYDTYYISSKGNLPTVVDIMVPSGKPLKSSFPPGRSVMAYGEVGSITPTLSFISLLLLSFYWNTKHEQLAFPLHRIFPFLPLSLMWGLNEMLVLIYHYPWPLAQNILIWEYPPKTCSWNRHHSSVNLCVCK